MKKIVFLGFFVFFTYICNAQCLKRYDFIDSSSNKFVIVNFETKTMNIGWRRYKITNFHTSECENPTAYVFTARGFEYRLLYATGFIMQRSSKECLDFFPVKKVRSHY